MDQESACRYHCHLLIEELKYGYKKINQVAVAIPVAT